MGLERKEEINDAKDLCVAAMAIYGPSVTDTNLLKTFIDDVYSRLKKLESKEKGTPLGRKNEQRNKATDRCEQNIL